MSTQRRASTDPAAPTDEERKIFRSYDKNKTSGLEIDELRELMSDLGLLADRAPAEASSYLVATFTAADADRDRTLSLTEFAAFYRRATAPRLGDLLEAQHPEQAAALHHSFERWAAFGSRAARPPAELGATHWMKLCRDAGLVGAEPPALRPTDADLVFMKVRDRHAQRLTFHQFVDALGMVAARQGKQLIQVVRRINAAAGPRLNGARVEVARSFDATASASALGGGGGGPSRKSAGGVGAGPAAMPSPNAPVGKAARGRDEDGAGCSPADSFKIPAYRNVPQREKTPDVPAAENSSSVASDGLEGPRAATGAEDLLRVYASFAGFGTGGASHTSAHGGAEATSPFKMELDSKQFAKLCKDAGLVGGGPRDATPAAVDLCFAKARAKGARRLAFGDFLVALALLAAEKHASEDEVLAAVAACPGPRRNSCTPEYVRLAERASFTGVYARGGPKVVDEGAPDLAKLLSREPSRA